MDVVGPYIESRLRTCTILIWTFFIVLVWGTHYWRLSKHCIYTIWCGIRHEVAWTCVKCLTLPAATAGQTHLLTSRSEPPHTCVTHWALGSTSAPHFWKLIFWFISSQSDRLQVMQLATFLRQHKRHHCSEIPPQLTPAVNKCSCARFVTGVNTSLSLCGLMFSSKHLQANANILWPSRHYCRQAHSSQFVTKLPNKPHIMNHESLTNWIKV